MSEQAGSGADMQENFADAGAAQGYTAGALLRHARESMGVHIAALAVALKVPVSKIEALEEDRYDEFPDNVFMRALAASVSRTLKIDPAQVLALLPSTGPQALQTSRGLNASFRDPTGRFKVQSPIERPNKSRWVGIAVAVLLVGALAVAFFPQRQSSDATGGNAVSEPVAVSSMDTASEPATQPADAASLPDPSATTAAMAAAETASSSSAPITAAMVAAAVASAPLPLGGVDGSKALEIRAREASWIKIVSAVNGVMLQRELAAGETIFATGEPPWQVTVGRPDVTDVIVRGQPMSMEAYGRGKVARFEVK